MYVVGFEIADHLDGSHIRFHKFWVDTSVSLPSEAGDCIFCPTVCFLAAFQIVCVSHIHVTQW